MKNSTKSLLNLLYLCCSMSLVLFILTMFGRLLGAWLAWDMNDNFPFSSKDLFVCLKLTWMGLPAGFIFWYFYYR
ncbi:hypothetical protein [Yersinia intermedia]|jgi:hypothetical protein|uniref:hypothetical protein n=1 Tax=Yersinia intermedia TaxID=631 RepID=UPI001F530EE9|nr:hypothetical protein [Yersinia intermedia]UNK22920.1 hypothetical protein MNQ97_19535 [Yersinia intermedia]